MITLNRKTLIKICSLIFLVSVQAQAYDLGLSGNVRGTYWSKIKKITDDKNFFAGSAFLKAAPEEFLSTRFFFEGYIAADDLSRSSVSKGDVREAYLAKSFDQLSLKVGRQIIVWGRGDKINPTDNLTQKDITIAYSDDEEGRLGLFNVLAEYQFESSKLIFVAQPEWRPFRFPIKPITGITITETTPEDRYQNFAVKWDYSSSNFDASVSYYDGFDKSPDLSSITFTEIGIAYNKIKVYGFDFATNIDKFGLRTEWAYTQTKNQGGTEPGIKSSFIYGVVGIDRTFFDTLNINAQGFYKDSIDFKSSSFYGIYSSLNAQLQINSQQMARTQSGYSTRINFKLLNETLDMEVAFVQWQPTGDFILRPKITYSINDHLKALAGVENYQGSSDTFFGRLNDLSTGFAEVQYYF